MSGDVLGGPVTEEDVQQTLISTCARNITQTHLLWKYLYTQLLNQAAFRHTIIHNTIKDTGMKIFHIWKENCTYRAMHTKYELSFEKETFRILDTVVDLIIICLQSTALQTIKAAL